MPGNITLRLSHVGQILISRNRKVSRPWRWGRALVTMLVMATVAVIFSSLFLSWGDVQFITLNYEISQGKETQKQLRDLNQKLSIELANLTAISRLEKLAAEYGMEAPRPHQVVTLR